MYLREKLIKALKAKNILVAIFAGFSLICFGLYILHMLVYYRDDLETAMSAVDMDLSIKMMIIAAVLFMIMLISRKMIGDALFFSSYFEGDLDGIIPLKDLAEVTGRSSSKIRKQLGIYLLLYMKGFRLEDVEGQCCAVLSNRTVSCQCLSCGAPIEKSIYFTGKCQYCGSLDLFAGVIAGDRYYSISQNVQEGVKKPDFYCAKNMKLKTGLFFVLLVLGLILLSIFVMYDMDLIGNYNDKDYLRELLMTDKSPYYSYDLIKADILSNIIYASGIAAVLLPAVINRLRRIRFLNAAKTCSQFFSKIRTPFVKVSLIPGLNDLSSRKRKLGSVRGAIRVGYLKNCTLEMHGGELQAALAKKIVKDRCPNCAAPINGAADENYRCNYCGSMIMQVVAKR
ncbi:MAG: hypothetical protein IJ071_00225 [Ruminococcus sp.]|nr:hypothetical protein [Ruminococcus sp.]